MDYAIDNRTMTNNLAKNHGVKHQIYNLSLGKMNETYTIREIRTEDEALKDFLFTLGCYEGEEITIISILADNFVVNIKDARYSIDTELAEAVII